MINNKAEKTKLSLPLTLIIVFIIGSAFAYWTQELIAHNEFETASYNTVLEEIFEGPDNWMPGEDINKDVWIENKGSVPVFVKTEINQTWKDKNGSLPLVFNNAGKDDYAAQIKWGPDVVLLASGKQSSIDLEMKTVNTIDEAKDKWVLVSDQPDENGDFLLFYIGMVNPAESTPLLVDSVVLNPSIQAGVLKKMISYDKETGGQIFREINNDTYSYESARYTMNITAETVQATPSALKEVFGDDDKGSGILEYLSNHGLPEDVPMK